MGNQHGFIQKTDTTTALNVGARVDFPVELQNSSDTNKYQIWDLEQVNSTSEFMVKNQGTGKYLDVDRTILWNGKPSVAVEKKDNNSLSQKWIFNSDNTIVNASDVSLYLTVSLDSGSTYQSGQRLVMASRDTTTTTQEFRFVALSKSENAPAN